MSKVDALVAKNRMLVERLDEYRKGTDQPNGHPWPSTRRSPAPPASTLGLDSKHSSVEWLGEIPEHWEVESAQ